MARWHTRGAAPRRAPVCCGHGVVDPLDAVSVARRFFGMGKRDQLFIYTTSGSTVFYGSTWATGL